MNYSNPYNKYTIINVLIKVSANWYTGNLHYKIK